MKPNFKHKILVLPLLFFLFGFGCFGSESEKSNMEFTFGTVKYIDLEGGFYGIITDDNKRLDPINLAKEFQTDGKRIMFKYKEKKDLVSFHMWGTIVEILEIKEIKQ